MNRSQAYQQFRGVLDDAKTTWKLWDNLKKEFKKPENEQDLDEQLLLYECLKYMIAATIEGAQEASEVQWEDEERTNTGQDEYWAPRYDCPIRGEEPQLAMIC